SFVTVPSYASPADANGDNRYEVIIRVSDGTYQTDATLYADVQDMPEPFIPWTPPTVVTPPGNGNGSGNGGGGVGNGGGDAGTGNGGSDNSGGTPGKDGSPSPQDGSQQGGDGQAGSGGAGGADTPIGGMDDLLSPSRNHSGNGGHGGGSDANRRTGMWYGNGLFDFQFGRNSTQIDMEWLRADLTVVNTLTAMMNEAAQITLARAGVPESGLTSPYRLHSADADESDNPLLSVNIPQAVEVSGLAMSIGTIWWATRAGGLIASMVVSAPVWR